MISTADLMWFVGFYEGEGHITQHKKNIVIAITQKNREPLWKCCNLFGGSVGNSGLGVSRWTLYGPAAFGLAMTIYKLLSKQRAIQVKAAIDYEKFIHQARPRWMLRRIWKLEK